MRCLLSITSDNGQTRVWARSWCFVLVRTRLNIYIGIKESQIRSKLHDLEIEYARQQGLFEEGLLTTCLIPNIECLNAHRLRETPISMWDSMCF